jgi:hypothetical protein
MRAIQREIPTFTRPRNTAGLAALSGKRTSYTWRWKHSAWYVWATTHCWYAVVLGFDLWIWLTAFVAGAKFYYLRAVLHNQSPPNVRRVLDNIKAAMTSESVLLIDELVLPESGVSYVASSIDMAMLSAFASTERTEAQWREMFVEAGLELTRTYTYYPTGYESVMDVRLPMVKPLDGDRVVSRWDAVVAS